MKKFPVLLSVAAMLAGLCACSGPAASSGDNGSSPAPETDITFPLAESRTYSMFTIMNNDVALNDVMGFKKLEEMTNVHWEIQSVLPAELAEKQSLLLGSGQYPDVFFRSSLDEATLNKYGKNGTFIPLNNLIEKYAPNLKKELDTRLSARDKLTSADGNIYSLPLLGRDGPGGWINCFINQPWLTKLGLEMPTTLDEFYTTLKAFKTGDPNGSGSGDEIPFICTQDFLYYFLPNFGIEVDPNSGACNMAIIDGKYQHIYSSERYKEFLAYMTKLYSEGLLDKNTFIQDGEQIHAIGASGDTIGFFFDLASYLTVGRERDADFVRVPVFAEHVLPYATSIGIGAMAITDKCKNPEIVMSWADQFYTQEGGALSFMGVEGESYKKNADGSWEWLLGNFSDISTLRANACIQGGAYAPALQPDIWLENKADKNEYKFNHDIPSEKELSKIIFPVQRHSENDQKTLSTISADLQPYILQYQAQVITGALNLDSSWQNYIDTMNKMKLPQMIEIATKAYEAAA